MIEANPEKATILQNIATKKGNATVAVGNPICEIDGKPVKFYQMETGSSFLPENTKYFNEAKMILLECKTIDTLLKENNIGNVDILKLDLPLDFS